MVDAGIQEGFYCSEKSRVVSLGSEAPLMWFGCPQGAVPAASRGQKSPSASEIFALWVHRNQLANIQLVQLLTGQLNLFVNLWGTLDIFLILKCGG